MGNNNSQLTEKVERHDKEIKNATEQGMNMSNELTNNIAKIQKQLNILEERFATYLTSHAGDHSQLTITLKALQAEIKQLQEEQIPSEREATSSGR